MPQEPRASSRRVSERFTHRGGAALLVVLLAAAAIRAAALWAAPGAMLDDPDAYRAVADQFLATHTYAMSDGVPTAYRPPLYPCVVAACRATRVPDAIALGAVHWTAGLATVWLTWRLARRLRLRRFAIVAALAVAADPILLAQSRLVMTETLATLLAVVALDAIVRLADRPGRARAVAVGVCLGLASLCRPTFLPWAAVGCVAVPWCIGGAGRLRLAACLAFGVALCLLPWGIRNAMQFGRPVVTTTHGGYTLLLGNNESFYAHLREARPGVWTADALQADLPIHPPFADPQEELDGDRLLDNLARETIAAHPGDFVRASWYRVRRLWGVLPQQTDANESTAHRSARWAVAAGYAVELPLAALFALASALGLGLMVVWRCRHRQADANSPPTQESPPRGVTAFFLSSLLLLACFTAVHAVYWTDMRMRAPLTPIIAIYAGSALAALVAKGPARGHYWSVRPQAGVLRQPRRTDR